MLFHRRGFCGSARPFVTISSVTGIYAIINIKEMRNTKLMRDDFYKVKRAGHKVTVGENE